MEGSANRPRPAARGRRAAGKWRVAVALLLVAGGALAADDPAAGDPAAGICKLTLGDYRYDGFDGQDANLRYRRGDTDAWLGFYRDRQFGSQARTGIDTSWALADGVALLPSLQLAQGGFVGGSLNLQVGERWYGIAGLGRTNLKPYVNLNFDPNDAVTIGVGHQAGNGATYSITLIADDRLHTGQRDLHLFGQWPVHDFRISTDVLHKSGRGDSGAVRAWGATVTVDFWTWFVRVARDPKQNFSAQDALRLVTGVRI